MFEYVVSAAVLAAMIVAVVLYVRGRKSLRQEVLQALRDQEWSYMPCEFFLDRDIFYCPQYWVTFDEGPERGSDVVTIARRDPERGAVLEGGEILLFRNYDPIDKDPLASKIQGMIRTMRIRNGRGIHALT